MTDQLLAVLFWFVVILLSIAVLATMSLYQSTASENDDIQQWNEQTKMIEEHHQWALIPKGATFERTRIEPIKERKVEYETSHSSGWIAGEYTSWTTQVPVVTYETRYQPTVTYRYRSSTSDLSSTRLSTLPLGSYHSYEDAKNVADVYATEQSWDIRVNPSNPQQHIRNDTLQPLRSLKSAVTYDKAQLSLAVLLILAIALSFTGYTYRECIFSSADPSPHANAPAPA
jgi:hypothetical protein